MRKIVLLGLLLAWAGQAWAASEPQDVVKKLDDGLITMMKAGPAAGFAGRAAVIGPVLDQVVDLAEMTRLTLGAAGRNVTPEQMDKVVAAFRRFSVANYARNFDSFGGEKFEQDAPRSGGAGVMVVPTKLIPGDGSAPVELDYVLKVSGDQWKITDVLADGAISQMAARRSEFTGILRKDGVDGLVNALDARTKALSTNL